MATFSYTARDATGAARRGTHEGSAAAAVAAELRGRGWVVMEVRPALAPRAGGGPWARVSPLAGLAPRSLDVEVGCRQLAVLLRSGMSLLRALQILPAQARRRSMARVWDDVARRIQEGANLADALATHACFSPTVDQLVRVGEQTGALEQVLERAATGLERARRLRSSVVTAFLYPAIVILITILVTGFLVFSVLPKVQDFLSNLGRALPPMTQLLLDVSAAIQAHLVQGSIVVLAAALMVALIHRWPPGRLGIDRLVLRLPLAGRIVRLAATVRLARNLGDLLRSGIPLLAGLRSVERLIGNRHLAGVVATARGRVMAGSSLAEPLDVRGAFTPMLPAMIAVGESAGTLDEVLGEVASFHEQELETLVRQLGVLIEPLVIVTVGAIVGFVYLSVFIALYAAHGA